MANLLDYLRQNKALHRHSTIIAGSIDEDQSSHAMREVSLIVHRASQLALKGNDSSPTYF
ncbi:MAG: hypothetical protein BroJett015_35720 [Chloroflexota bacterium]|nr:MAG: hypothetical protein BroJett015_35720 [Chloroflexota bacterium]